MFVHFCHFVQFRVERNNMVYVCVWVCVCVCACLCGGCIPLISTLSMSCALQQSYLFVWTSPCSRGEWYAYVVLGSFQWVHAKFQACASILSSKGFLVKPNFFCGLNHLENRMFGNIFEGLPGESPHESLFGQINPIWKTPACRVVFTKQWMPMSYQQKLWTNAICHKCHGAEFQSKI